MSCGLLLAGRGEKVGVAFWESLAEEGELWFFQREGQPTWFQRVAAAGERVLGLGFFYSPFFFINSSPSL